MFGLGWGLVGLASKLDFFRVCWKIGFALGITKALPGIVWQCLTRIGACSCLSHFFSFCLSAWGDVGNVFRFVVWLFWVVYVLFVRFLLCCGLSLS